MDEQERIVKGIWIPIEIWKDRNLSWNEKILFLEIDSYTSKDMDCYISNEYIANLLDISETNANKTLSSLISKGYVIKTKFDGRRRYVKSALSITTTLPCQNRQPSYINNNTNNNNNNYTINNSTNTFTNKENDIDKSISKRKVVNYDEEFEKAWKLYQRKGTKQKAYEYWKKLSDDDKEKVFAHIPHYLQSNEIQYLKDFDGYLHNRYFERLVYNKKGKLLFDPERTCESKYNPVCEGALLWDEQTKSYMYIGYWDGKFMPDGYNDSNRPNGATVVLNNGRGTIIWDSETKKWSKNELKLCYD